MSDSPVVEDSCLPPATTENGAGPFGWQVCPEAVSVHGLVLHKFVARSADQLAALERACESGNTIELVREARTLQGLAADLSAETLQRLAAELERAAACADLQAAGLVLSRTRAEMDRCVDAAEALLAELALKG